MRTNFVNGSSSKTVLRPDFDTCSIQTHVPMHIMKLQIPKSDCTENTNCHITTPLKNVMKSKKLP